MSVARGCSGSTCTPQGGEKNYRNLQGNFVSAPPAHQVHPQAEQESIFGTFSAWAREIWRLAVRAVF